MGSEILTRYYTTGSNFTSEWELVSERTTALSFKPDGSRGTADGSFKIWENGNFEITLPLEETFNISQVIFSVINGYGINSTTFEPTNRDTMGPSNFDPIQQQSNPLETPFSEVNNAFTGEANRPELNRILTSTDFPEPIETVGLETNKEW